MEATAPDTVYLHRARFQKQYNPLGYQKSARAFARFIT
jgi:hypothetical protein